MENLIKKLKERGYSIGSVESMTGGLFAARVTSVSGASAVYKGSLITYAIEEKVCLAHVKPETIEKYGVVSSEVAREMAYGGAQALNVDVCVAVTGNAGPTVQSDGKPVGECHVAVYVMGLILSQKFSLTGDRHHIQSMCVDEMIKLVSNVIA